MNGATTARLDVEHDLPQALKRNELALRYQPQLEIRSGRVVGVEALLRWLHPTHGVIGPTQFISAAEDSGMIGPIGEWVLRTACVQVRAWQMSGLPEMTMAVNLSARQCLDPHLHRTVARVLRETGLDPERLELEITESVAMNSAEAAVSNVRALRAMGIRLSIDDFGTGYSALSQLKCCPVGKLKIDQSFVRNLDSDATDAAIVRAIIFLGHSLNMTVIAEGVESGRQLAALTDYGCDEIQGHLLAPPMAAGEIPQIIRRSWNKPAALRAPGEKQNDLPRALSS
jgi:EAL domain-containing protein (putative c-di-GMP-specific phosphodiesterase class I)